MKNFSKINKNNNGKFYYKIKYVKIVIRGWIKKSREIRLFNKV